MARIFVAYARADSRVAAEIEVKLRARGHQVFIDTESLIPGHDFDAVVRGAIAEADVFVFLVSRSSLRRYSYALTELKLARKRWPNPEGHVIPVLLRDLPARLIPPYLSAVAHMVRPEGNVATEAADAIASVALVADANQPPGASPVDWPALVRHSPSRSRLLRRPRLQLLAALVLASVCGIGLTVFLIQVRREATAGTSSVDASDVVTHLELAADVAAVDAALPTDAPVTPVDAGRRRSDARPRPDAAYAQTRWVCFLEIEALGMWTSSSEPMRGLTMEEARVQCESICRNNEGLKRSCRLAFDE